MRDDVNDELNELLREGQARGSLDQGDIDRQLANFRNAFGPEALEQMDGMALLRHMHGRGKDEPQSMVYWLEYKNDEEFATRLFGGIGGGSAQKFGLVDSQPDGVWLTGSSRRPRAMTPSEAIDLARQHRVELLAGHRVLQGFDPDDIGDSRVQRLDRDLREAAPGVYAMAWAHKYWHLIHPHRLDTFHTRGIQRFHLCKLLQDPVDAYGPLKPEQAAQFVCTGRYLALARELGVSTTLLCKLLGDRTPRHAYWKVGTTAGGSGESQWASMRDQGFVSIGWQEHVTDLSNHLELPDKELKAMIAGMLHGCYGEQGEGTETRKAGEILNFATRIALNDLVLACEGESILGIGRVAGPYEFREGQAFPHVRPVEWLHLEPWRLPTPEGPRTTVYEIGKWANNVLEIERRVQGQRQGTPRPVPERRAVTESAPSLPPLDAWSARVEASLRRKGQAIFYGPPGTGKTYRALRLAQELAARHAFNRPFARLSEEERQSITGPGGLVRACTFHPNWGYEDFLEGVRPSSEQGAITFVNRDGLFKTLCADAARDHRPHFLVIDEINRGDIPRIFGELLTVIEMDKRDQPITLPVTGQVLRVPRNVFILGTMNTADRSISLLDAALRRRFAFIELMPDSACLAGRRAADIPLGPWLDALNARLRKVLKRNARNLQVGHAYLMPPNPINSMIDFGRVVRDDIIPLLEDYCYDDFESLQEILGKQLVDVEAGCIREALFMPERQEDLKEALAFPELGEFASDEEAETETSDDDLGDVL